MARPAASPRKAVASKSGGSKARAGARTSRTNGASLKLEGLSAEQKVMRLLADREQLLSRIAALEADAQRLRDTQAAVADRVTWALDSLRDLLNP